MSNANERITLNEVCPGYRATVMSIDCQGPLRRRLMDMGLTPGTKVCVEGTAPLGDPLIVCARGCRLGLRRSEAAGISVMPFPGKPCSATCMPEVRGPFGPFGRRRRHGQAELPGTQRRGSGRQRRRRGGRMGHTE